MSILIRTIQRAHNVLSQSLGYGNSRSYIAESVTRSPFESNILRIIRNEMEFLADIAPPHQVLILMHYETRIHDTADNLKKSYNNNYMCQGCVQHRHTPPNLRSICVS